MIMKNFIGGAALAVLMLSATAADAKVSSYTVDRFEWTGTTCEAVSNRGTVREVIAGVTKAECGLVSQLQNVQIDYTHAENGTGYLARVASPLLGVFTCWYTADGVATACQDQ